MLTRFRTILAAAIALSLTFAVTAAASTFTFQIGNASGSTDRYNVTLALTVDPAITNLTNRTFYATDFTRIDYAWTNYRGTSPSNFSLGIGDSPAPSPTRYGSQGFITTDANGRGTLTLASTGERSVIYFQQFVNGNPWIEVHQGANTNGSSGILFQWRYGSSTYMQKSSPTALNLLSAESYPAATPPPTTISPVPLPASALGLILGFLALAVMSHAGRKTRNFA